jgi:hypothetical protein
LSKILTVTIKDLATGEDIGKIVASYGVKINRNELMLSFNSPENAVMQSFYLDEKRETPLKIPFKVKKSFVIFVEFIKADKL